MAKKPPSTRYWTNDQLEIEWQVSHEALKKFRNAKDPLPFLKAGRRYLYVREEAEKWARRQAERSRSRG